MARLLRRPRPRFVSLLTRPVVKLTCRLPAPLGLVFILLLGACLRFGQLTRKPLWVDEVITAIFALGRNFEQVPLDRLLTVAQVPAFFQLQPQVSCSAIAQNLAAESTHPPLFFCLLHRWLVAWQGTDVALLWQLRALPVLAGLGAIAALYGLNRLGFSRRAGLAGAAVMAVSPFAVYLSQEARHYTLPLLWITLSLAVLIKLQQAGQAGRFPLGWWGLWGLLQVLSWYTHYFCSLAIAAQGLTLLPLSRYGWRWGRAIAVSSLPLLLTLPWLPVFVHHFTSPKTGWLSEPQGLAPLYQTLISWLVMVVALPVEGQPLAVQIPLGLTAAGLGVWVAWRASQGYRQLLRQPATRVAALTLGSFLAWVLLAFFLVSYGLGKDISLAPRYHFVYYPAIAALLGASFATPRPGRPDWRRGLSLLLLLGFLSSGVTIFNGAFQKPYHPTRVAQQVDQSGGSVLVVMAYGNTLEIAVGLSYALALARERATSPAPTGFAFWPTLVSYEPVWAGIAQAPVVDHLWVIAPGYIQESYPVTLPMVGGRCQLDPAEHHRIGFPYQLYRCQPQEGPPAAPTNQTGTTPTAAQGSDRKDGDSSSSC